MWINWNTNPYLSKLKISKTYNLRVATIILWIFYMCFFNMDLSTMSMRDSVFYHKSFLEYFEPTLAELKSCCRYLFFIPTSKICLDFFCITTKIIEKFSFSSIPFINSIKLFSVGEMLIAYEVLILIHTYPNIFYIKYHFSGP